MTQLYLAYSHENAPLADQIAAQLTDIDCIHHVDTDFVSGQYASVLQESENPVVLLVTDNFIKNEVCMSGALGMLLSLMRQNRILPVLANGIAVKDGVETSVETHIDRVINAIQYMNYWQQEYLALSDKVNHEPDDERMAHQERLQYVHSIADQTGEFISALRDADFMKWEQLAEAEFTDIYRKLNIPHSTSHQHTEPVQPAPAESIPMPEPPEVKTTIPVSGPVWFQPATPMPPYTPSPIPMEPSDFQPENHLVTPGTTTEEPAEDAGQYREQEIQQTISDAWGWIERGNLELGVEVLRLATEQYPDHAQLKAEYERAQGTGIEVSEITDFEQEANSYEAAGDSAFQDGDYLMAKYCWDRAAESNQDLPGIWRKLGLLTSDQLSGYTETSITYLNKALSLQPDDSQVIERLTALGVYVPPVPEVHPPALIETVSVIEPTPVVQPEQVTETSTPPIEPEEIQSVQPEPLAETTLQIEPEEIQSVHPEPVMEAPVPAPQVEETAAHYLVVPEPAPAIHPARRNEIVLITGATSGIGRATAVEFASHGYRLIITGRRAEKLQEVKADLMARFHSDVLPLVFDVRDNNAVEAALHSLPDAWKNVDILINNAGLAKGLSPIHEGSLDHWETMIDTNIKGMLYVSRIISQGMVQRRKGHIVNLSSSAGKEAYPNGNVYSATKFAVEALTKSMRLDLHKYNIRVSQVSPGHVEETEFAINRFDGDAQKARIYDDFTPLKASDVAETIWFIASRPAHVNIQDVYMFGTQQASATVVDRSGRKE